VGAWIETQPLSSLSSNGGQAYILSIIAERIIYDFHLRCNKIDLTPRWNKVFSGEFETIIHEINEAIAA